MNPPTPSLITARAKAVRFVEEPGFQGRGPVYVLYGSGEYGPVEISHLSEKDPNACASLVKVGDGQYVQVTYDLREVRNLRPVHLPYLRFDGDRYVYEQKR